METHVSWIWGNYPLLLLITQTCPIVLFSSPPRLLGRSFSPIHKKNSAARAMHRASTYHTRPHSFVPPSLATLGSVVAASLIQEKQASLPPIIVPRLDVTAPCRVRTGLFCILVILHMYLDLWRSSFKRFSHSSNPQWSCFMMEESFPTSPLITPLICQRSLNSRSTIESDTSHDFPFSEKRIPPLFQFGQCCTHRSFSFHALCHALVLQPTNQQSHQPSNFPFFFWKKVISVTWKFTKLYSQLYV